MEDKVYYFITVFEKFGTDELGWPDMGCRRTWGFYSNKKTAIQALHENWTNMEETIYEYAVLEGFYEGISNSDGYEQWFKFDDKRGGYFEIDKPIDTEHFCYWALG